jgi:hypothetical protein
MGIEAVKARLPDANTLRMGKKFKEGRLLIWVTGDMPGMNASAKFFALGWST